MVTGEQMGAMETIRSGLRHSPELTQGLSVTLILAVISSIGQVIVPIAVQQAVDNGLRAEGGPDLGYVSWMALACVGGVLLTGWAAYAMTARLFRTAESGLATLRIKALRHVHDLPLLTQNT
jgi:ABC-type multidrug transport system fused ATPase/permease subunit